jgi:hypothetical protein
VMGPRFRFNGMDAKNSNEPRHELSATPQLNVVGACQVITE